MKKFIAVSLSVFLAGIGFGWAQGRMSHSEYIEKYKHIAIEHQDIYGIPVSIKLAQGLLESDCGNSRLAVEANNHFGIKCKSDWTGETISHDDDAKGECFRKYESPERSFLDHSEFLDKSARYQALFDLDITDYKGWAHGLKAAGYATNPHYAELLIKIIEDYELYALDTAEPAAGRDYAYLEPQQPLEDVSPAGDALFIPAEKVDVDNYVISVRTVSGYPVYHNNGSEFVVAAGGDTYGRIAAAAGVSEAKLRKFNDVTAAHQPKPGEQVYIRQKGKKATNGKLIHTVKEGETMHSISQMYGVRLKNLSKINRRPVDAPLRQGQQIRLM
ncbi:MAG: glucosaminidase domain-containing protein [Rikenellaceae bacterium]|nr:glucosaminidase domain-containing protein [Rikenellaceae bacterium]